MILDNTGLCVCVFVCMRKRVCTGANVGHYKITMD